MKPAKKQTSPVKSANTSPKSKKKKYVKNTLSIIQFKKMIGKGLISNYKNPKIVVDEKKKESVLSGGVKTISLTGFEIGGTVYIFDGCDRFAIVNNISYADIKKHKLDIDIVIIQYSGVTPKDLVHLTSLR